MRWLISLMDHHVFKPGTFQVMSEGGHKFEVIEDPEMKITPYHLQDTHCCSSTAEALAKRHPDVWQIVDDRDLKELDRLYALE